jgi:hypothetical protein
MPEQVTAAALRPRQPDSERAALKQSAPLLPLILWMRAKS